MIQKLVASYGVFFSIYGILIERFSQAYRIIVDDVDVAALLGFMVQFFIAIMALNQLVFVEMSAEGDQTFSQVWFVILQLQQFALIVVVAVTYHLLLRLGGLRGSFVEIFKFFIVMTVFLSINTLGISFIMDYYLFSMTDFFSSMSDWDEHDRVVQQTDVRIIFAIQEIVLPVAIILLYAFLFYFSVYRHWVSVAAGLIAIGCGEILLTAFLNPIWLAFLNARFPT